MTFLTELQAKGIDLEPVDLVGLGKLRHHCPNLPLSLLQFYETCGGMKPSKKLAMRLLMPAEIMSFYESVDDDYKHFCDGHNRILFATDDNSNYAGCFVTAPLAERVFILNHEEPYDYPLYRSPMSLIQALLEAAGTDKDWFELTADYPTVTSVREALNSNDADLAATYYKSYQENPEQNEDHAFYCLQLLALDQNDLAMQLAQSPDMWIQEHACKLLGMRRHKAAIPMLATIAKEAQGNGVGASILALKNMGYPESTALLAELKETIGSSYQVYFR